MPQNVASDQDLHRLLTEIFEEIELKYKHPPETPKTRNGLIQMMINKPTGQHIRKLKEQSDQGLHCFAIPSVLLEMLH